ncbi:embryonic stem cell-specific 5-hydroxymethylcytosine-binding protein-like isoform X1 [Biomphalaria pfeifferi]|uniref:Abasic site processing protein HMCES n=1 Tax=Biomphalaria pfeifferi TaxID=112525 RepID=A0AAD8F8E7_BIOPF|nr:embryonic stem cell-specific 5-hydroxymethylcytosine-binding protein-like isoform X1 [Biomphalaria pfeifferi]
MCGRTACTLEPNDIAASCTYTDKNGTRKQPHWVDAPGGQKYYPSYNKAPTSFNPVLTSSQHFVKPDIKSERDRILMPMKWGMTPSWYHGDPYKVPYETNNCRAEGMLDKKTYKVALKKGYRCVVLADGFFEWQTTKEGKQAFLFYFPQPETVKFPFSVLDTSKKELKEHQPSETCINSELKGEGYTDVGEPKVKQEFKDENSGDYTVVEKSGPRLLTMAGVFDVWDPHDGSPPLYSYSVITVSASSDMAWCHHRMPAILTTDEEIQDWLDFSNVPLDKAVSLIKPQVCLTYHPVSKAVNSSKCQSEDCVKPIELGKSKSNASSNLMLNWLKSGSPAKKKKI